ncbi:MAG: type VI secretion system tip protein TssI/VgrG, partial [Candidatus Poribacteria bacterium]|nr:type VI secretion system tip protein TssI/VgrG [Candidatus Poribacteria bacterium]
VQGGVVAQDVQTRYENEFECIPTRSAFRPRRNTPKPIVQGIQTAIVVGPKGEEIYTDAQGRVKVQFHWDTDGKYDDKSSCWLRVGQAWAGAGWGSLFLPRVGNEVVVNFIEGDPDQPIIIGSVYNGDNLPPYKLPAEKTKSTIKSNTSKGGKGFNEIRFDDKKGDEQIFIHAENDMDIRIKNDGRAWLGRDQHVFVKRDTREQVERDKHILIGRDEAQEIKRDYSLKIKGKSAVEVDKSQSVVVKGDMIEEFKKNHSEQTTQNYYLKAKQVVIEAMTGLTIKVGGNFITINSGGIFIKGNMVNLNSGGSALSGSGGSVVSPAASLKAEIADTAKPGKEVTYKFQRAQIDPVEAAILNAPWYEEPKGESADREKGSASPPDDEQSTAQEQTEEEQKKTYIEIELLDEEDKPVTGERFWLKLPDGKIAQGRTDELGIAKVAGLKEEDGYKICFPDLDKDMWEAI